MRPLYAPSPQAMLITELKKHTILLSNSSGNGFSGGNSGGAEGQPPPPPTTFRKSAQFVGNVGSVGIFKTIEYTKNNKNNYWCGRQLICTERKFDYRKAICLI